MERKVKESELQKQILDFLKLSGYLAFKHRNVGIFKKSTGSYIPLSYGEKGISDIIALSPNGVFTAIECKVGYNKPSKEQLDFISEVNKRGGVGIVAYSLDDVLLVIHKAVDKN